MALSVVIAGGGIGGLTAALCLHAFGHQVTVFETAPQISEVGAGLQISPNGMKVLAKLGLAEQVVATGFSPQALEFRLGRSGRRVFQVPLDSQTTSRWGAPYVHIHRADLIDILHSALEARAPGCIHLNSAVEAYDQSTDSVRAILGSGDSLSADVLIGADGLHSTIRAQMFGPDAPIFTGNMAWRAVVPVADLGDFAPPPTACVWAGSKRHAVTYRLRGGTLANFVGVVETSEPGSESWTQEGARAQAAADFEGWNPVITHMIDKAPRLFRWALFDREPLPKWHSGRVALLGDACHPMLPFAAQGAVMAIEDAWVLASSLSTPVQNCEAALATYFRHRIRRATEIQASARRNMKTFHKSGAAAQTAAYAPMWLAGKLAPGIIRANRDRVYAYDVTTAVPAPTSD